MTFQQFLEFGQDEANIGATFLREEEMPISSIQETGRDEKDEPIMEEVFQRGTYLYTLQPGLRVTRELVDLDSLEKETEKKRQELAVLEEKASLIAQHRK
jgi:hypothetical protein